MIAYPRLLASAALALAASSFAGAQTTVIAYGGSSPTTGNTGYVTAHVNLGRQATTVDAGSRRTVFSDSLALSPATDYTGPVFYGGYEILTNTGANPISAQRVLNGTPDGIQIPGSFATWSSTTTTASMAGFLVFKQSDWRDTANAASPLNSGGVNISNLAGTYSIFTTNDSYSNASVTRWILQDSLGQYYVSQATITANTSGITTGNQDVNATNWAAITPATSGGMNLDLDSLDYSTSGAEMASTSIVAVGLYFEADSFTGNDLTGSQWSFQLNSLGFTGTAAIPEPSVAVLFCGLGGLMFVVAARRRRGRS